MDGASARRWPGLVAVLAAVSLTLSGCDEGGGTLPSNSRSEAETQDVPGDWLDIDDNEGPAAFLARMTGADSSTVDDVFPAVAEHFRESPRMVANRTLQIWQISRTDAAGAPDLEALLQDLALAREGAARISLGSVAQLYRVQRDLGENHDTALRAALEEAH